MKGKLQFDKHIPPVLVVYQNNTETEEEQVNELIKTLKEFKYDEDGDVIK